MPDKITVPIDMAVNSGNMYLKTDWIHGDGGGQQFEAGVVANGPIIQIKVGKLHFDCDLTPLIKAAITHCNENPEAQGPQAPKKSQD